MDYLQIIVGHFLGISDLASIELLCGHEACQILMISVHFDCV
jgi:hypothetical protein